MPDIIIIVDCNVNVKFLLISPDIKYNVVKYIPPINAPFNNPFFLIFKFPMELPTNILIAVTIIITGAVNDSLTFVYANTSENINKHINVNIIDIVTPFIILIIPPDIFYSSFYKL